MNASAAPTRRSGLLWIAIGAVVILALLVFYQAGIISKLRPEAQQAGAQKKEIDRLRNTIKDLERLRAENPEVKSLRREVAELGELRLKLASLEDQYRELEKQKNPPQIAALARDTNTVDLSMPVTDANPGTYFSRESWTNAGFATALATIETMFWSLREGSFEKLVETMSDTDARGFVAQFKSESDVETFWRNTRRSPIGRLPGYFVVDVEHLADNRMIIYLNTPAGEAAGLEPSSIGLTRFGDSWKIDDSGY